LKDIFETTPQSLLAATSARIDGLEPRSGSAAASQIHSIIERSRGIFAASADPRGLTRSIDVPAFSELYAARADNDEDTPLEGVVDDAESLALFAVTLGEEVSSHISRLFSAGELAEGYILDQIASFAADELASVAARRFERAEDAGADSAVLPYSPGYCGWHVSGQQALFAHLEPMEIGISLNDSSLMHPVKSVSGVLVLAPIRAHEFSPAFPCCATCTTMECQERAAELRNRSA
jgi:hypothetical protein